MRSKDCQTPARKRSGLKVVGAQQGLTTDRPVPSLQRLGLPNTGVHTHTPSAYPPTNNPYFPPYYSGARLKSISHLFCSQTIPGEGLSPALWLLSLHSKPSSLPQAGPSCSSKVLLRTQQLIWQIRPPDIGATSIQDKQLALSVHRKSVTFLVVLHTEDELGISLG